MVDVRRAACGVRRAACVRWAYREAASLLDVTEDHQDAIHCRTTVQKEEHDRFAADLI